MLTGLVMVSCAAAGLTEPTAAATASRRSHDQTEAGIRSSDLFALSITLPDTLPWIANDLKANIATGRRDDVRSHLARNDRNRHDPYGFVRRRPRHRRRAGDRRRDPVR